MKSIVSANSKIHFLFLFAFIVFQVKVAAQAPVAPPGTNLQSWLGNTFSVYINHQAQERVPEELEDIKLGNGVLFFAGYHERGGGGAAFNTSDGSFTGRYDGFNSGFGSPVKSVAADANNVYFGTPEQGVQKYVYGGSISPVAVYLPGKSITGLCIKNGKMYISNWTDNKIHVYTVGTMTEDASWAVTNPTRLTVDNNNKIWVIQWDPTSPQNPIDGPTWYGKNILSYSNTGAQGPSITNFEKAKCVAIDGSGQLLVGGLNEHSQIWKFGNLTGTPSQTGTFGVLNGIFSGIAGQFTTTAKLHWISGIDVDANGNIYVACRYGTFWGAAIEKFNPAGDLLWRNFCGSSLDCAGIDPENETEVYSKYHRYSLDYSKTTPGSEWSLKGFTVNRFKYPNDYRVNFLNDVGERSLGQGAIRIQGKLFMLRSYQSQYDLELYRFDPANDGEVAIPSVIFQGGNDGILTFNPGTGNWVPTIGNTNYKQYWEISSNGDIYSLAQISNSYSHINKFLFQGFDNFGNPMYNASTTLPIPGNSTYRASGLAYDEATDCQYLIASKNIEADGDNKYIRCIQNWSTTPKEKWTVSVPFNNIQYTPGTNYGGGRVIAIDVAGDYVFLAYGYGHIRILNKLTGALVGTLTQNMNGWIGTEGQIDAKCGLNVTKRSNGEYVVLFENATMGNIQMHRWTPDLTNYPVLGVSVNPVENTLLVNETVQLTATFTPTNSTNQNVSWSTSNAAIAIVNTDGLVTGRAAGTATITVTTQEGSYTAVSSITVTALPIGSWIITDDKDPDWFWSGYAFDACGSCFEGSAHSTDVVNNFASYTFTGTEVEAYCETWDDAGSVDIYIDGDLKGSFAQNILPYGGAQKFATISGLTNGSHTIKFVSTSMKYTGIDYIRFRTTTVLPLQLIFFTAKYENGKPHLKWKTENEINVSHFNIERSSDGYRFDKIKEIVSRGGGNYSTVDEAPKNGYNYYRLKMVDKDGRFSYSNVEIVKILNDAIFSFIMYPNPNSGLLVVEPSQSNKPVMISIFDQQGRLLLVKQITGKTPIAIQHLAKGIYTVKLINNGEVKTGKLIKQ